MSIESPVRRRLTDALRMALQSSAAVALTYGLAQLWEMPEVFTAVLSAVFVIDVSVPNTVGTALARLGATLLGILTGFTGCVMMSGLLGPGGALGLSIFLMNLLSLGKANWRYGAIAAVAMALDYEEPLPEVVWNRSAAIFLGLVAGTLTSLIIWPERGKDRARKHGLAALRALRDSLAQGSWGNADQESTALKEVEKTGEARTRFHREMAQARESIQFRKETRDEGLYRCLHCLEQLKARLWLMREERPGQARKVEKALQGFFQGRELLREELQALDNDLVEAIRQLAKLREMS